MTAAAVLARLDALGVAVVARGDSLTIRPASAVPSALLAEMKVHKAEVLALLAANDATNPDGEHDAPAIRAEHELVVLAVRVRVAVWRTKGAVTAVELVTRDDARRPLVDAVDARLRAGMGLADQAVEQVALADLIRELRLIELAAPADVVT